MPENPATLLSRFRPTPKQPVPPPLLSRFGPTPSRPAPEPPVSRFEPSPKHLPQREPDPPWAARFWLQVDGMEIGAFTELGGLGVTIETEDLVEGGQNGYVLKLAKAMRWQNVVLKRGVTDSDALLAWLSRYSGAGLEGQGCRPERVNATITVYRTVAKAAHSWHLERVMPVRWSGPRLSSTAHELAIEELEVSHCGLTSVPPTK